MEVHHHAHTARKNWKHFFWEFLMLFLAVFCGFMAENLREHYIEHKREVKYIRSIVKDLATDTAWMNSYLLDQNTSIQALDSVILLLKTGKSDSVSRRRVYYLARVAIKMSSPNKINYSAFDQMRNSGNLRLIKKQESVNNISHYYFGAKDIEQLNETIMQRQASLVEFEGKVFDGTVFQSMADLHNFEFNEPEKIPSLITSDKTLINDFIVRAHYLISANAYSRVYARRQKDSAISLINYLNKEYHLK